MYEHSWLPVSPCLKNTDAHILHHAQSRTHAHTHTHTHTHTARTSCVQVWTERPACTGSQQGQAGKPKHCPSLAAAQTPLSLLYDWDTHTHTHTHTHTISHKL